MEVTSKFGHIALNIDMKQNHHSASLEGFDSPPTWVFSVFVVVFDFLFCCWLILSLLIMVFTCFTQYVSLKKCGYNIYALHLSYKNTWLLVLEQVTQRT